MTNSIPSANQSKVDSISYFCCPRCGSDLRHYVEQYECQQCDVTYPIRNDIICFQVGPEENQTESPAEIGLKRINRNFDPNNWTTTVKDYLALAENSPQNAENLLVEGRYAWKIFLALRPDTVALNVGCGLGTLVKNIAPHVKTTFAMDSSYERLTFAQNRFSLFNPNDDIRLMTACSTVWLPFKDNSVDVVFLPAVLELLTARDETLRAEIPTSSQDPDRIRTIFAYSEPREAQLLFLREVRRILKPAGQLFIEAENRFSYEYFRGKVNLQSGSKYLSLLPRFLQNRYSLATLGKPYRNYTYSARGYQNLLKSSGFPELSVLGLVKDDRYLDEILPFASSLPYWHPGPNAGLKAKLVRNRVFVPSFGLVASSEQTSRRVLLDEVLVAIASDLAADISDMRLTAINVSRKEKIMLRATCNGQAVHIRIPLVDASRHSEKTGHDLLRIIRRTLPNTTRTPIPLASRDGGTLPYYVETHVAGKSVVSFRDEIDARTHLDDVIGLLFEFNPELNASSYTTLSGQFYKHFVTGKLAEIFAVTTDPNTRFKLNHHFEANVHGCEIFTGIFHGDFSMNNVMLSDARHISGLIDWEYGAADGLPLLDAINYMVSFRRMRHPEDPLIDCLSWLVSGDWPDPQEQKFLFDCFDRGGIPRERIGTYAYLWWLEVVTVRLRHGMCYVQDQINVYINNVVDRLM